MFVTKYYLKSTFTHMTTLKICEAVICSDYNIVCVIILKLKATQNNCICSVLFKYFYTIKKM